VVIKPSGVPYEAMKVEDLVVLDLDGNTISS
jgi:ribulose-5-phosphate 4-epimerase/fuculose-1-phosphate aldolase